MVSSKRLNQVFNESTSRELGVKTRKQDSSLRPKTDVYALDQNAGGYRVVRQNKGGTAEADISDRYSAKEMNVYLRGMEAGARIKSGKRV